MSVPLDCCSARRSSGVSATAAPAPRLIPRNSRRLIMRLQVGCNERREEGREIQREERREEGRETAWLLTVHVIPRWLTPLLTSPFTLLSRTRACHNEPFERSLPDSDSTWASSGSPN